MGICGETELMPWQWDYKPVALPWRTLNVRYPLGNSTSKSPLSKQADNSQLHEEIYHMISDCKTNAENNSVCHLLSQLYNFVKVQTKSHEKKLAGFRVLLGRGCCSYTNTLWFWKEKIKQILASEYMIGWYIDEYHLLIVLVLGYIFSMPSLNFKL